MAKCNPANKAVERAKENRESEETVEDLLETYDELKERKKSLSPYDVEEFLPDNARLENGELVATYKSSKPNLDTSDGTLTPQRKKILNLLDDGTNCSEISAKGISSESYAYATRRNFGFLLDNPALKEAFLSGGLRPQDSYVLRFPENDIELTYESLTNVKKDAKKYFRLFDELPVIETFDGEEINIDQMPNEEDDEDSHSEKNIPEFSTDEWKSIVAALNRDGQDDLASVVIDRVW